MVFKDGCPMQPNLTDKGDTEEDKALKHVVKVKSKQCPMIGQCKGKEHDLGHQQSSCETCLAIIVGFPTDK